MDAAKALRRDFRVTRLSRTLISVEYLHPGYRLIVSRKKEITSTGLFRIFRLQPKKRSFGHAFWARWDNEVVKGRPGPPVKIELDHPPKAERAAFKRGHKGYAGHWPAYSENNGTIHVSIEDRGMLVLRGVLSVTPTWAVDFSILRPGEVTLEAYRGGQKIADVPLDELGPAMHTYLRVERRERRKGRSTKAARHAAFLAASRRLAQTLRATRAGRGRAALPHRGPDAH